MKTFIIGFLLIWGSVATVWAQDTEQVLPERFEMQWGDSTVVMQQYFVVFLKTGPNREGHEQETARIQEQHLAHLDSLYEAGYTSITGPMGDEGEIRGIVVFNTATLDEARRLAESDPAVKAGRLTVEVHPWWAARGSVLR